MLSPSQRRTLERLRDRLRDDEREGFRSFTGSNYERADHALRVREEIGALDAVIKATTPASIPA